MRSIVALGIISFAMNAPTPTSAQEAIARGVGTATCAEYAEFYRQYPSDTEFYSWAQGFMSGWNLGLGTNGQASNLSASDAKSQQSFIRDYCDKHPLQRYVQAVMALLLSLPKLAPRNSN